MKISEAFSLFEVQVLRSEDYRIKTVRNYKSMVKSLINAIGDIPVELVSDTQVTVWKEYLRGENQKPSWINSQLGMVRVILRYLEGLKIPVMDAHRIKDEKKVPIEREWLKPEEMQALIDAAKNPRDRALLALLAASACRISEILQLDRGDIVNAELTPEGLYQVGVIGKGDRHNKEKYRTIFIDKYIRDIVLDYINTRPDRFPPIFITIQNTRMTVQRAEQITHEATRNAGLTKHVTPHILRHSRISDLLNNGAPMHDVKDFAGHANITTTINIYKHVDDSHKRNIINKYASPLR